MIKKYFLSLSKRKFIFLTFFIPFIYTYILSFIFLVLKLDINNHHSFKLAHSPFIIKLWGYAVLAPFLETFIFQFIVIEILLSYFKNRDNLVILIAGFLFGFAHYFNSYNIIYSIFTMVAGVFFAATYIYAKNRKDIYSAFLLVFLIHASINLTAEILNHFI